MSKVIRVGFVGMLSLILGSPLYSQDYSQHFISAKSGMVNYVEGKPLLFSGDKEEGNKISARDQLKEGDRLQTRESDRVEVLLNPGSYLRVAGDSQIKVLQTGFDDMHFGITHGVAILEAGAFDKKVHSLRITTPAGDLKILENGLYRFQVSPSQSVQVLIYSGKAKWLRDQREIATLKGRNRYDLGAGVDGKLQYAKLNNETADTTDLWSKRRAEFLVAANDRLSPWMFNSAFLNYGYGYRGGWVYNPFFSVFTFAPFDYGFYSPYGLAYGYCYPAYGAAGYARGGGGGKGSSTAANASNGSGGANGTKSRNSSVDHRSSASRSAPSPSARMESGRADQGSRSSTVHSTARQR